MGFSIFRHAPCGTALNTFHKAALCALPAPFQVEGSRSLRERQLGGWKRRSFLRGSWGGLMILHISVRPKSGADCPRPRRGAKLEKTRFLRFPKPQRGGSGSLSPAPANWPVPLHLGSIGGLLTLRARHGARGQRDENAIWVAKTFAPPGRLLVARIGRNMI